MRGDSGAAIWDPGGGEPEPRRHPPGDRGTAQTVDDGARPDGADAPRLDRASNRRPSSRSLRSTPKRRGASREQVTLEPS
ncbi:MAG: hypothetical protein AVDCRST_MAG19-758 [uncultured Thermomicrobiales bacterium]|uniref:Uncharacterized protein n=1 Tax=uncultured Thermomicrobiales bacterium TaxID=1645740 RepID=A0A6J4UHA2_9BACT|nr:MAG: hypothetical protein AVDCRST_MAG19-758 [uncultured Thermomicrobiales bacterium]